MAKIKSTGNPKAPKPLPSFSDQDIKKFWARVDAKSPEECWLWTGTYNGNYGVFKRLGRMIRAPRIAYFLKNAKDPFPLFVCHTCDNPPCCNPRHFFLGTNTDNQRDAAKKNRFVRTARGDEHWTRKFPERVPKGDNAIMHLHPELAAHGIKNGAHTHPEKIPRGVARPNSKLTEEDVRKIRTDLRGAAAIAKDYGVGRNTVTRIQKFLKWKHVL
jgi:hypothetical protein